MKIVIVGGVAAGASAAARARRLDEGAEIVVFERGAHVSFANCGLPYHIGGSIAERDRLLLQTPASLRAMLNLDVRTEHDVTGIDRDGKTVRYRNLQTGEEGAEGYDKLVLCPGASPIIPDLPGLPDERVFVLRNVDDMDRIKEVVDAGARSAVIIGAGYIGIEMAENLRERGLEVDVVELLEQILPPLDREMTRDLEAHMRLHGVRLHLGTAAAAFRRHGNAFDVELEDGNVLTTELVVMCVGVRPESALARDAGLTVGERGGIQVNAQLQTSDPDIYAAGDAIEVLHAVTGARSQIPLAGPANRQGRSVADSIFGRKGVYTKTLGTSIVKVFDMTAGGTGLNERALRQSGTAYEKVYIHPSGHAGYYPGTAPLNIKVLFKAEDGKLLGAQVTGFDGVDKRIDVFATAISADMTVQDLQSLELAYAPPYVSAKDPVNMAGFVGANLLAGDIALWYAEEFPKQTKDALILDVRTSHEYEAWHIPGARNISLGKLRAALDELDRDRPILAYCRVGFRSYLAYRLLQQHGFTRCRTLAGGTLTFCAVHGTAVCDGQPKPVAPSYAEEKTLAPPAPTGSTTEVDLRGLQCPGPIRKLLEAMNALQPGDQVRAVASDPGFGADGAAWCKKQEHEVLSVSQEGADTIVEIRKGHTGRQTAPTTCDRPAADKKTMVVFSGDLDKVLAAFVIANGAVSMGAEVTLFFTFWGLNALRKDGPQASGKGILDRMFGWMMPAGARKLKLSNMNMMGAGTAMMKHVMASKRVDSLPALMRHASEAGVKLVACSMSMDVMGIQREELIDGVEIGGVASFLGESDDANMTLFI